MRLGDYRRARTGREKLIRYAIGTVMGVGCLIVIGLGALIVRAFNDGRTPDWSIWLAGAFVLVAAFVGEWMVGTRRKGGE